MKVDGKKISKEIRENLKRRLKQKRGMLCFSVVYAGDDPAIDNFIAIKKAFAEFLGIKCKVLKLAEIITEAELRSEIEVVITKRECNGMLIQLPLPAHINNKKILDLIPSEWDMDVLSSSAFEKFSNGNFSIMPPVVGAIDEIFKRHDISLKGKKVLIVGRGRLVGRPVAVWIKNQGAEFEIVDQDDNISSRSCAADVIISGVGKPGIIKENMVKEGVVLIDVGTGESQGKILGDIDLECFKKSSLYTPTPGGVGPITVSVLFRNLLDLNEI